MDCYLKLIPAGDRIIREHRESLMKKYGVAIEEEDEVEIDLRKYRSLK